MRFIRAYEYTFNGNRRVVDTEKPSVAVNVSKIAYIYGYDDDGLKFVSLGAGERDFVIDIGTYRRLVSSIPSDEEYHFPGCIIDELI